MVSDISISDVGDCALDPFDNCEQFHKKFKDKSIRATLAVLNDSNLQEDGRCYVFLNTAFSFSESKSECEGAGGMLPWFPSLYIDTEKVNQVMEYFKETTRLRALKLWTGLVTEGNATVTNWVWICPNSKQSIEAETSSIKWSNSSKAAHVEGFAGVIEYSTSGVIQSKKIDGAYHTVLCVGLRTLPTNIITYMYTETDRHSTATDTHSTATDTHRTTDTDSSNTNEDSTLNIPLIAFLTIVILILLAGIIYIGFNKYMGRGDDSKRVAMQINEPTTPTAPILDEPTSPNAPILDEPTSPTAPRLDEPTSQTAPRLDESTESISMSSGSEVEESL